MKIMLNALFYFATISAINGAYISTPTVTPVFATYPNIVPSVASHSQSAIRSLDGNSVLSSYSKTVETPHSSVRKYDTRFINDGLSYAHIPAIPSYHTTTPVYHTKFPSTYVNPHYSYSPASYYTYPTSVYHPTLHSPSVYHPTSHSTAGYYPPIYHPSSTLYQTPSQYVNPGYRYINKPIPVHSRTLPYSDAATVSHISFNGLGTRYAW